MIKSVINATENKIEKGNQRKQAFRETARNRKLGRYI